MKKKTSVIDICPNLRANYTPPLPSITTIKHIKLFNTIPQDEQEH